MTEETTATVPAAPRRALYIGLGLLAVVLSVFALGKLGHLPGLEEAESWLRNLADSPWGLPAVILVFCAAAFIGVPQFALIAAAIAVVGPLMGAVYEQVFKRGVELLQVVAPSEASGPYRIVTGVGTGDDR